MSSLERPTRTIKVSEAHTVVVYDYISGGELRKVQALYLRNVKAGEITAKPGLTEKEMAAEMMKDVPASVLFEAQDLTLKMLAVSVDGCPIEEAYQAVQDLLPEELTAVLNILQEYINSSDSKNESSVHA